MALVALAWSALQPAFAGGRVALVIGNSAYSNTPALANPGNDAEDVARGLNEAGFKVTLKRDASKRDFDLAIAQFTRDARDAEAALFYFAGHGMQFNGANYIMPVDAQLQDEVSLRYEMVNVGDVKLALESASGVKILVLDSCRDNPLANRLARSLSGASRSATTSSGLAPPQPSLGMIVVYATQSGHVAMDGGVGRNSPFAKAFVEELAEPGLEIAALFRGVEQKVLTATNGLQSPELSISGVPEYYLTEAPPDRRAWDEARAKGDAAALTNFLARFPASSYARQAQQQLKAALATTNNPNADALWLTAEKSGAMSDYLSYLKAYPTGVFAATAINRIAALAAKSPGPDDLPPAKPPVVVAPSPAPAAAPRPTAAPPISTARLPPVATPRKLAPVVRQKTHPTANDSEVESQPASPPRSRAPKAAVAVVAPARAEPVASPTGRCTQGFVEVPYPQNGPHGYQCAPK